MTTTKVERAPPRVGKARTMIGACGAACTSLALQLGYGVAESWPSDRYKADPVAYFREVLGTDPWSRQVEVIEAVRDHPRVAIKSGHKVSKSHSAAGIALWFYCSFSDARVVMSSTTSRQVDAILWRELRMMKARAKRPIDGEMHDLARSGLKALDFREIVGFTAREAEAVAGISGANLLYILDESSGIPDVIYEAIEGNMAGGARVVMFSNPTKTEGFFFDAFHEKSKFWETLTISSEESPNVLAGRAVVPGLALREWIAEKKEEWGEDSPIYKVRIKGEFPLGEDGKIFSIHRLALSEQLWFETPATGRLQLGVDPAGEDGMGDEIAICWRRGAKMLGLRTHARLSPEGHVDEASSIIKEFRKPGDPRALVVVDKGGPIGIKVYRLMVMRGEDEGFDVVGLDSGDKALRMPKQFGSIRDELHYNAMQWMKDGGAILEDAKLTKDLHAPSWVPQDISRSKATPKTEIRKFLGRSPDRGDAFMLSVWEPTDLAAAHERETATAKPKPAAEEDWRIPVMDPYASLNTWGGR